MDFIDFPVDEVKNKPYEGCINGMPQQGEITNVVINDGSGIIKFYDGNRVAFSFFQGTACVWKRSDDGKVIVINDCGYRTYRIYP